MSGRTHDFRRASAETRMLVSRLQHPSAALAKLWILRLLVDLEGWQAIHAGTRMNEELVLRTLGFEEDLSRASWEELREVMRAPLAAAYAQALTQNPKLDPVLRDNLSGLGALLGIGEIERALLAFTLVLQSYIPLAECTDGWGPINTEQATLLLAGVLALPVGAVRTALSPDGLLARSGLLLLERKEPLRLVQKLTLLTGLGDRLMEPHTDVLRMLASFFRPAAAATLNRNHFGHVAEPLERIRRYLRAVIARRLPGANLLLYGPPGTGKTELARVIAASLRLRLYEVVAENQGEGLTGQGRFGAYRLSQTALSQQPGALVLFDEVEDVFAPDAVRVFGLSASGERRKAWVNGMLEGNPVPTLWISNDLQLIDPAFLRRFDYILKLDPPPRQVRKAILAKHLEGLPVREDWIERVADHPDIVPALVSRSARVASLIASRGAVATERHLEAVLAGTLEAMGQDPRVVGPSTAPIRYRLEALNPDRDLVQLGEGLRRHPCGRFCLYGPPGTGKSAWARHLADSLDRSLLAKRASDLLGPYVGQTEKAIARMFRQAEQDQAVLLLDEADSFLRDRRSAHQSWEVTQVNELLTQMERFGGLFICSTNLLDRLAPGDFALVVRQNRLTGEPLSPERLYTELAREVQFKRGGGKGMGFLAHL